MSAKLYIKKPMPVEAMQFKYTAECWRELGHWMGEHMKTCGKERKLDAVGWLEIMGDTDEDGERELTHVAYEGDYIVKGYDGLFYPMTQSEFNSEYYEYKYFDGKLNE